MKYKTTFAIALSALAIIGGVVLNFQEFSMGSPATVKNLIVTSRYSAIWILVLIIGGKSKIRGIVKYCSVFWAITLFSLY